MIGEYLYLETLSGGKYRFSIDRGLVMVFAQNSAERRDAKKVSTVRQKYSLLVQVVDRKVFIDLIDKMLVANPLRTNVTVQAIPNRNNGMPFTMYKKGSMFRRVFGIQCQTLSRRHVKKIRLWLKLNEFTKMQPRLEEVLRGGVAYSTAYPLMAKYTER